MIKIDNIQAIEIAKNRIRAWRETEFKNNDLAIQNALVDGTDTSALIERRDYLKNLTSQCDNKTVDELLTLINELGC